MNIIMSSKRNWIIALLIVSNFIMAFKLKSDSDEKKNLIEENKNETIDTTSTLMDTLITIEKELPPVETKEILIENTNSIKICKYDPFIQKHAASIDWDWRLIASIIYKESKFDASARSGGGMVGLMQLVPSTGYKFGLPHGSEYNPEENIKAGISYIKALDKLWSKVPKEERTKFIIASYNSGEGHIKDAARLAAKYGKDPLKWDGNVEVYLGLKNQAQYYKDPVVKCGYFNGPRTVNYVKAIFAKYAEYKSL